MNKLEIWGAGMAGLIAANVLRKHNPVVYEAKSELPHNHKALLRFRTNKVSIATGIPFKKVKIKKAIWDGKHLYTESNLMLENLYSQKVTGTVAERSISNFHGEERYIAPSDFIERLAEGIDIRFNSEIVGGVDDGTTSISTLPMPLNMKIAGLKDENKYDCKPIYSVNFKILSPKTDVYQTIYDVTLNSPFYRLSISGDEGIFECMKSEMTNSEIIKNILGNCFGLRNVEISEPVMTEQKLGKIIPVDDTIRKNNILNLSREKQIYSLGRFATWRQIMLDDIIDDIDIIEKLIQQDNYNRTLYAYSK